MASPGCIINRLSINENSNVENDRWRRLRVVKTIAKLDLGNKSFSSKGFLNRKRNRVHIKRATEDENVICDKPTAENEMTSFEKFRHISARVRLFIRVFTNMRRYAAEKGGHSQVCTDTTMQLQDAVVNSDNQQDLLFNPDYFKCQHKFLMPFWAKEIALKRPNDKTESEIRRLASLLRQLHCFRKYTRKMQCLLAKVARYESFGRRRVVIRKGHIGMAFYLIFSGSVAVVVDGNEDKAFNKDDQPQNTLERGAAFGELALVRRMRRSATIVCLEKTEFLVIGKDEFFEAGIHNCVADEMTYRFKFLRQLPLFETWKEEDLKIVSQEARIQEFLCDKVVLRDSTASQYIFFVSKGQCDVIRLLDLTAFRYHQPGSRERLFSSTSIATNVSTDIENISIASSKDQVKVPIEESDSALKLAFSDTNLTTKRNPRVSFGNGPTINPGRLSLSPNFGTKLKEPFNKNQRRHSSAPIQSKLSRSKRSTSVSLNRGSLIGRLPSLAEQRLNDASCGQIGLGVFLKVDTLTQGQASGLSSVLEEEEKGSELRRRFTLLSAGCELIAIAKDVFKEKADETTLAKVRTQVNWYPCDSDLHQTFRKQNGWRTYREQLVDHMSNYKNSINKALSDRCCALPKIPRPDPSNCIASRPVSPAEEWQRLADSGYIANDQQSAITIQSLKDSSSLRSYSSCSESQHPFVQGNLMSATGSGRTLVLTHGGARVNRLKSRIKTTEVAR